MNEYLDSIKERPTRAENFKMVDIEINALSSFFAYLKTNLDFKLISRA